MKKTKVITVSPFTKHDEIIKSITSGNDEYFSLSHFHPSNMADYTLMASTIEDMTYAYAIDEIEAAALIADLTFLAST